jgi:hypothetical protein
MLVAAFRLTSADGCTRSLQAVPRQGLTLISDQRITGRLYKTLHGATALSVFLTVPVFWTENHKMKSLLSVRPPFDSKHCSESHR